MRSIELILDDTTDAHVRAEWRTLAEHDLPSLASHTAASNAPHVTVVAGEGLEPDDVPVDALATLPLPLRFGALSVFPAGRGRFVLVRTIVVTTELLALHAGVAAASASASTGPAPVPVPTSLPGAWVPHVTLARRLTPEQVALALPLLDTPPIDGALTAARFWDGDTKTLIALKISSGFESPRT
ncbi:2'-5' RNA ligase family protein [Labedella endophytica]|uniref:2'-5' RNA ligase family protein n=1 Tax=Labedella endophytica TaxID=1523160 RepID=A0A3S0X843_9MICO|nr:2'-5' RNA ligase family protein [Labedella endophytica]RUR01625.1 2'-5' RNA ligase family protein [Labedella endophytica]